ncbi:MAG TPA: hypothetical protein VHK86_00045, partial [Nitrososphaera sp.]|nr:hypothetical protein [Nitrososphaera sp.]
FVEEGFYMGWQACTEFIAEGGRRRWMVTEQEIRVAFDKYDMEPWTPEDKAILRNDRAGTEENFLMFKAGAVFGRNAGLEEAADVVGKRTGFLSTTVNSCEAMRLIRALKTAEVDNG